MEQATISNQSQSIDTAFQKQLLELKDVRQITGLSATTIYKHMKLGQFPEPKKCGGRAVRWRIADIQAYINA